MPDSTPHPFRRVVLTGTECSGKTTLGKLLAEQLGWPMVEEAARTHHDVLEGKVTLDTFDELHELQTEACAELARSGHPGVVCDTGDLVLGIWSDVAIGQPWHPLMPPWPPVDLYILCPPLTNWEMDPLRTMPQLEDRQRLHEVYVQSLTHRHHIVIEGETPEDRLSFLMKAWPW